MAIEFTLPELGENIETGDVVQVLVAVGDTVAADQPVVELETDKATIEVPSPAAGTVASIAVQAGDSIAVGQLILTLDDEQGDAPAAAPPSAKRGEAVPAETEEAAPKAASGEGASKEETEESTRTEETEEAAPREDSDQSPTKAETEEAAPKETEEAALKETETPAATRRPLVLAAPSVRRLAREFGIPIAEVVGSGTHGRVTADDVKLHSRRAQARLRQGDATPAPAPTLPDFARWGAVRRERMAAVRRATARQMATAWQTIPHVTQHDRADITGFEALRARLKKRRPDLPLTITAFTVKVLAAALAEFPQFNASIDVANEEVVFKDYVSVGVAVDTERGLLVPVLRDAGAKSLGELSREIAELAEKARSRKITLDELQGGTFTVTNLGGLGGTCFTPIVNHPEVAILGLSRSTREPVFENGAFVPRLLMPLSLSYDHRLIDGADAVRFLRWVAERLEQPLLLDLD